MIFYIFKFYLTKIISVYKLARFRYNWRIKNSHNFTIPVNHFSDDNISVGLNTYGPIHVMRWDMPDEGLTIGNFCSIASGVKFILGGNHNLSGISTYPISFKLLGRAKDTISKGTIVIKDDVWIGSDVTILSGVTIGQGTVIAAGSVVTKDIESYYIAGGNPCKIIKKRFADDVTAELEKIDMSTWNAEYLRENEQIICHQSVNLDMLKGLK